MLANRPYPWRSIDITDDAVAQKGNSQNMTEWSHVNIELVENMPGDRQKEDEDVLNKNGQQREQPSTRS